MSALVVDCINTITCEGETASLYRIGQNIYKLDIPPINSLFLIRGEKSWYFIDAGKNDEDITRFAIPLLRFLNVDGKDVAGILITHNHWDHVDGLPALLRLCSNATVYAYKPLPENLFVQRFCAVDQGDVIDALFQVVTIPGHTADSVGFVDMRTNALFSGDALQLYGISTCGMYIFHGVDRYINSLKKLQHINLEAVLSSHPYVPHGAFAMGKDQAQIYIKDSLRCAEELVAFTKASLIHGVTEPSLIKAAFIEYKASQIANFPTDGFDKAIESIIEPKTTG